MTADPREIHRTHPDYVIHDPTGGRERPWDDPEFYWLNEHILVHPLSDGSLLATWTAERIEAPCIKRIGVKHSIDGGGSWSPLVWVDGCGVGGDGQAAGWAATARQRDGRCPLSPPADGCTCCTRCASSRWASPADCTAVTRTTGAAHGRSATPWSSRPRPSMTRTRSANRCAGSAAAAYIGPPPGNSSFPTPTGRATDRCPPAPRPSRNGTVTLR